MAPLTITPIGTVDVKHSLLFLRAIREGAIHANLCHASPQSNHLQMAGFFRLIYPLTFPEPLTMLFMLLHVTTLTVVLNTLGKRVVL